MITTLIATAWGWSEILWVALIGFCLVVLMLMLLVGVMKLFGMFFTYRRANTPAAVAEVEDEGIAAIATALKIYRGALHDKESEVLTILGIKRAYSPWNSKIHGLTQLPDRK